jgi:hypothetical protein
MLGEQTTDIADVNVATPVAPDMRIPVDSPIPASYDPVLAAWDKKLFAKIEPKPL